jgi:MFS transporter, DHA2 family, multidrug resistance protein
LIATPAHRRSPGGRFGTHLQQVWRSAKFQAEAGPNKDKNRPSNGPGRRAGVDFGWEKAPGDASMPRDPSGFFSRMTSVSARDGLTPLKRGTLLVANMFTVTLYFTTILVVSTVLPQIQGAMSATPDEVSWIITFNILAIAIATPMTGWLATRFGSRNTMCACVAGFVFSTLMCGLAQSLESLVFWRIVQGAVGAPTVPLAQSILLDIYPKEEHRFVMGLNGMGTILGPIIGPALAGYLAEDYGWRWAFHMLVPVSVVSFIGLFFLLPRDKPATRVDLDWTGFLTLAVAIGCLQYVLARGPRLDWFEAQELVLAAFIAVVAFYAFIAHSLTTTSVPLLDFKLLLDRNLVLGFILVSIFGMLAFTPMVVLPTLLRNHVGYPDALVGWVIGSRGVGGLIGFFAAMWIDRIDPRLSIASGFVLLAVSGFWLTFITLDVTPWELAINGILQGMSIGVIYVPLTIIAFTDLEPRARPEALGIFHLLRNITSSLFISITVAEILASTGANHARLVEFINPFNPVLSIPAVMGAWETETLHGIARLGREIERQSALIAYVNAFGLYTLVAAAAIPIALAFKSSARAKTAVIGTHAEPGKATAEASPELSPPAVAQALQPAAAE